MLQFNKLVFYPVGCADYGSGLKFVRIPLGEGPYSHSTYKKVQDKKKTFNLVLFSVKVQYVCHTLSVKRIVLTILTDCFQCSRSHFLLISLVFFLHSLEIIQHRENVYLCWRSIIEIEWNSAPGLAAPTHVTKNGFVSLVG